MKRTKKAEQETVSLRVDVKIRGELLAMAEDQRRTLSQLCRIIIEDYVEQRRKEAA